MKQGGILILIVVAVLSLAGCSEKTKNIAERENNKYNMTDYKQGNLRAKMQGHGLNTAFLSRLKDEFGRQGMPLTHETYAEGNQGHISYSYFINGDPGQFVIAHAFSSEAQRIQKMSEMYSDLQGDGLTHSKASNAGVIYARSNTALVYASQAQASSPIRTKVDEIFRRLMAP